MNLGASEKNEEIANKYKREVNVSLEMTSFWKLKTFSEYVSEEENNLLKYGDIIWLHSETNAFIKNMEI